MPKEGEWPFGESTLEELKIIQTEVPSVRAEDSCLDALHVLYTKNVHALAITKPLPDGASGVSIYSNLTKKLLGSISMSDIKEILSTRQGWRRIFDQSFQFFQFLRSEQGIRRGQDAVPSFTVSPETTLISVIKKLAAVRAHQIWVVNAQHELLGVVSVSDIIPLLV